MLLTGGDDYNPGPYSVTFPSGVTIASFDISITDDNIFEGSEDVKIEIVNASLSNGILVSDPDQATITIVDDDGKTDFVICNIYNRSPRAEEICH